MATLISTIITRVRVNWLREPVASYWSDAELLVHAISGINDLWRKVLDLHEEHYLVVDDTNVSLTALSSTLTGIPTNAFRVLSVDPRDLSSSSANIGVEFVARDFNHPDFQLARRTPACEPRGVKLCYTVLGAGPPVDTLTVRVAPQVTAAMNVSLAYLKTHGVTASSDANPIPGESDLAVEAWIAAYARAKEREDQSPDPEALAIYANEKQNIALALTPRQEQELPIVEGMFEGMF